MFCAEENDTYISIAIADSNMQNDLILATTGRNEIIGIIGRCYDDLLIKKSMRKCRILGSMDPGRKLPNSTYTGTLGMLQSHQADLYLRGQPDYLHEDWLHKSTPVFMESVVVGQMLPHKSGVEFFNLMENFNVGIALTATYLLSFFAILALAYLLNELAYRIRFGERRIAKFSKKVSLASTKFRIKISKQRVSAIGWYVLYIHWFMWITELFLTNNIKVVDTSELIKNERDIFRTKRPGCMIEHDQLHNMILTTPKDLPNKNILLRIYEKKTYLKPKMVTERKLLGSKYCLITKDFPKMFNLVFQPVFVVGPRTTAYFVFITFWSDNILTSEKMWMNNKAIFEFNLVLYYSLRKSGNKKRIDRTITNYNEAGLFVRLFRRIESEKERLSRAKQVALFETVDAFIEELAGFSDLDVNNFRSIFILYFLFGAFVLVTFFVHRLVKFTKARIRFRRSFFYQND